jgi:hypothetical protein
MTPQAARSAYKRLLGQTETVTLRRFHGTGTPRSKYEQPAKARVQGYDPQEFIGTVLHGDRRLIVLAEDLEGGAVALPILVSDKIVVRGKEIQIIAIDDNTRRVGSTLCAYELQVRG